MHVPLTDQTCHLVDEAEFSLMKPDAILINTSRGGVVNETALVEALPMLSQQKGDGKKTDFKFLVARVLKQDIGAQKSGDAVALPKALSHLGSYNGLDPLSPVIAFYSETSAGIMEILETLSNSREWAEKIEAVREQQGHIYHRRGATRYTDQNGKKWNSLSYNLDEDGEARRGYAEGNSPDDDLKSLLLKMMRLSRDLPDE